MSKCRWWKGGHSWVTVAKGHQNQTWYKTYDGMKIAGSEYTRKRPTIIQRCTKCQALRAFDGWDMDLVSIDFAKQKIVQSGGIVDVDLK